MGDVKISHDICNISDISVTNIPKCSICTRLLSRDVSSVCLASWLISYDLDVPVNPANAPNT